MAFVIDIKNDGPDGTIVVIEHVNDQETFEVFNDHIDSGDTKSDVSCKGTGRKKFSWTHKGNGHIGTAEKGDKDTLYVDPQG